MILGLAMKRSKRINNIKKIKSLAEKDAVAKLSHAISVQHQVLARHQELLKFRQEYQDAMAASGRQGVAASKIVEFQKFIENLNRAIEKQAQLLSQQDDIVNKFREQWQFHRKALSGVENWMDEVIRQERAEEDAVEQKEIDELANRRYFHRN